MFNPSRSYKMQLGNICENWETDKTKNEMKRNLTHRLIYDI